MNAPRLSETAALAALTLSSACTKPNTELDSTIPCTEDTAMPCGEIEDTASDSTADTNDTNDSGLSEEWACTEVSMGSFWEAAQKDYGAEHIQCEEGEEITGDIIYGDPYCDAAKFAIRLSEALNFPAPGYTDGYFRAENILTRAQGAQSMQRAYDLPNAEERISLNDVEESDWFYNCTQSMAANGICSMPGGYFYPGETLCVEDRPEEEGGANDGFETWIQNAIPALDGYELQN